MSIRHLNRSCKKVYNQAITNKCFGSWIAEAGRENETYFFVFAAGIRGGYRFGTGFYNRPFLFTLKTPDAKSVDTNGDDPAGRRSGLEPYIRPDSHTRVKRYVNGLFGPVTLAKNVATAGYATWRNSPEEWGDHWEGFGRRVASNLGKNAIKQSVTVRPR